MWLNELTCPTVNQKREEYYLVFEVIRVFNEIYVICIILTTVCIFFKICIDTQRVVIVLSMYSECTVDIDES